RRTIFYTLKIAISAALLYWAFHSVDLTAIGGHFARLDPLWVMLAMAALSLQIVFAGLRWARVTSTLGVALSPGRSMRITTIALFFNQALPSTIGGDAMRVWLLGRADRRWKDAIFSVIVDRVAGVAFLAIVVAACLPWSLERIAAPEGRAAVIVIGLAGVAALPAILIAGSAGLRRLHGGIRILRAPLEIAAAARTALFGRRHAAAIAVLSIGIHFLTIAAAWLLARSIAVEPDPLNFLILIPPVMLVAMIPVSIGGWGIREGAMVVAFGYTGMAPSQALAVSVLMGGAGLLVGAIGGALWLAERLPTRNPAAEIAAQTKPRV
ncbi:MAG: lysylphosphatidylglycerol synthase transmembrane domain-containing protein, partial [Tepidisphaeraceae bacterium]